MKKIFPVFVVLASCWLHASYAQQPGSLSSTFNPGGAGANNVVNHVLPLEDGKFLIAGTFSQYNGTARNGLARLNADGTLDTSFDPGQAASGGAIRKMALQSDGKIIIVGAFTAYTGTNRNRIARLNADGTLDTSFDPGSGFTSGTISNVALQSDNKIIVASRFATYNNVAREGIVRINTNGSIDNSFDPGSGFSSTNRNGYAINSIEITNDDKIIVTGRISSYNGVSANGIIRLNPNGSVDNSFNTGAGFLGDAYNIYIQSNGQILVSGIFGSYNNINRNTLIRINSDGSLDETFTTAPVAGQSRFSQAVYKSLYITSEGKIIAGGNFTKHNNIDIGGIIGLNENGSVNSSFDVGAGVTANIGSLDITTLIPISNNRVIIAGNFSTYKGASVNNIAAINLEAEVIAPTPEINVKQNGITILSDNTFSDFGSIETGKSVTKSFQVENLGPVTLNLTGTAGNYVVLSGSDASDFSLSQANVGASIEPSQSASFDLTFTPTAVGTRTAALTIISDDPDEPIYTINLKATSVAGRVADINIKQLSTDIASGDTYTFSSVAVNSNSENIEFTVQNLGRADLTLTQQSGKLISIEGDNAESFTIERSIANATITPGASETFTIKFTPKVEGANNARLTIISNDLDESPYTINLTGEATKSPVLALQSKKLETGSVYPNPGSEYVNIKMPVSQGTLRVFNNSGKQVIEQVVKSQSTESLQVSFNSLSPGLYFIEINNGKDSWVARWIKQP